jgi:hypothetical protein
MRRDRVSDHTLRELRAKQSSIVEPKQDKVANMSCKQSKHGMTVSPALRNLSAGSYHIISGHDSLIG